MGNGESKRGGFHVVGRENAKLEWGRRKKKEEISLFADF